MNAAKLKMLGTFAAESGKFYLKRKLTSYPERVETIVVDLDYTILNTLTAYRALEKILGPERAVQAYAEQKALVKVGKANFADVKKWGHNLQAIKGWTRQDWERIGLPPVQPDGENDATVLDWVLLDWQADQLE